MCEDVKSIKEEVSRVFEGRFKEIERSRPEIRTLVFKNILEVERDSLEVKLTREAVRNFVWESDGEKSLGPDGLNSKFL